MTGVLPFTGEESQIIHEILADAPTPPSKLCPIAKELGNIILTCLKKCKEERYQNVEELLRDLNLVGN
jgi:serine/threonine protein kinase